MEWIPIVVIAVLALIIVISNIHIVQQSRAYVIERLGAFSKVWQVGMHVKVPFIERVAKKVSLKEQVLDYPPQPVITKDNVTMQIDTVVYYQITDPRLYTYGVERPMMQAAILKAEAEKQAAILKADGEAQAIMAVQKAMADSLALLNEKAPNDQVLKLKALEAMQKVADGKATKIIIPSELQGFAGLASGIAETVKETK